MMHLLRSSVIIFAIANSSVSYACLTTSSAARQWVYCSYKVAKNVNEHRFMLNYFDALRNKNHLLGTASDRWASLYNKIKPICGSYKAAIKKDTASGTDDYIPQTIIDAFANIDDYDQ
jgi:hypothetical protein